MASKLYSAALLSEANFVHSEAMDLLLLGPCFCVLLLMLCVGLLVVPCFCDTAICILYGFDNHLAEEERVSCLSMAFLILCVCFVCIFSNTSFSKYSTK